MSPLDYKNGDSLIVDGNQIAINGNTMASDALVATKVFSRKLQLRVLSRCRGFAKRERNCRRHIQYLVTSSSKDTP